MARGPISVTIKANDQRLRDLPKAAVNAIYEAVREETDRAVTLAKALAPVDTGALRDSITDDFSGSNQYQVQGTITVGVPYGIYQELGTRFMAPHPFLLPAMDAIEQGLWDRIAEVVRKAAEEA